MSDDDYIECPCCGGVGAEPDKDGMYMDDQPLVCGCEGNVSCDEETEPYINIDICHCVDKPTLHKELEGE